VVVYVAFADIARLHPSNCLLFAVILPGLLYYWTKYVKRKVSVLKMDGSIENWVPATSDDGTILSSADVDETVTDCAARVRLKDVLRESPFRNLKPVACFLPNKSACPGNHGIATSISHFMGVRKPWKDWMGGNGTELTESTQFNDGRHYWQYSLLQLNERFNAGINFTAMGTMKFNSTLNLAYRVAQNPKDQRAETNLLD